MTGVRHQSRATEELPRARIERNWQTRLFWLIPLGAAALAGWFIYSDVIRRGPTIHIIFDDAQSLQAGKSDVKYRGAQIGTVKGIKLMPDHEHVDVTVLLKRSGGSVARENSRFWIVRAQLSVQQIQALQTIVSGDYVTVDPGDGKPQTKFNGLAEAPILEPPGDLNVVLLAESLGSVRKRAPVYYRGIQVGQVRLFDLDTNSQTVRITVQIQKQYAPLVRLDSKFWNAGGININVGLRGADITAQSAETLLSGGIAFATPDVPQKPAPPGTSFRLYDKPEEPWLKWSPAIKVSPANADSQQAVIQTSR